MSELAQAAEPVSFDEVKLLHETTIRAEPARTQPAASGRAASAAQARTSGDPPVMNDSEIDRLLKALGDDDSYRWIPTYTSSASRPKAKAPAAKPPNGVDGADGADNADSADDGEELSMMDRLKEVQDSLGNIETTMGTIDDTTVESKEKLTNLEREVETLREDVAVVKEQSLAVHELREDFKTLQKEFNFLRKHVATMMRLLSDAGSLGRALGVQLRPDIPLPDSEADASMPTSAKAQEKSSGSDLASKEGGPNALTSALAKPPGSN